jgi:hypothetical protein
MFLIVLAMQIADLTISFIPDMVRVFTASLSGVSFFVFLSAVFLFGQFLILEMIKAHNTESKVRHGIKTIAQVVTIIQYSLSAIILVLIIQVVFSSHYDTSLLAINATISYGLTCFLMGILAYWMFSWFRVDKSLVLLLYGLAAGVITVNTVSSIVYFDVVLADKPAEITPQSQSVPVRNFEASDPMSIVATVQAISLNIYFLLTWGGTIMILYHNLGRIGKARFWILVTTPLLFFMGFYITFYHAINPPTPTETSDTVIVPLTVIILSGISSVILFGTAFFSIARSMRQNSSVRDYMMITGYGVILFFIAAGATITGAGYPPYGILNVSLVGPVSFLILVGLYRSAVSISQDAKLRRAISESQFLKSIGSAEIQLDLQKKVIASIKANAEILTEQSGIEPSLTDDEVQSMVEDAIEEVRRAKIESKQ